MTEQTTVATKETPRPAALDQEYVVGGDFWWYRSQRTQALALPWAIDVNTQDFGDDLYDRMERDGRVSACATLLRASILEDGITLSPAVSEREKDGYEQAVELAEFCERVLADLESSLDDILWDMLGCLGRGNRVAEIVYHPFDSSPLPGRAVLENLVVKPRRSTSFVVTPYMKLIGILGRTLDAPTPVMGGALVDPASAPNLFPREKFAVASYHPENNDPRGTSAYAPAYTPWWMKMQVLQDYLKYLAQFASPLAVGKTPQNAPDVVDRDTGERKPANRALMEALIAIANGTALVVPFGTEFDLFFSSGEGMAFLNAMQSFNAEITIAITTQTLATSEAKYGARAQSEVHQDALETLVRQGKRSICRMLQRDVLRNLVRYNYGDQAAQLTPIVSLGETEATDMAALMTAISNLQRSGYLHHSQLAGVDRLINLPPRDLSAADPAPAAQDPVPPEEEPAEQGQGATA